MVRVSLMGLVFQQKQIRAGMNWHEHVASHVWCQWFRHIPSPRGSICFWLGSNCRTPSGETFWTGRECASANHSFGWRSLWGEVFLSEKNRQLFYLKVNQLVFLSKSETLWHCCYTCKAEGWTAVGRSGGRAWHLPNFHNLLMRVVCLLDSRLLSCSVYCIVIVSVSLGCHLTTADLNFVPTCPVWMWLFVWPGATKLVSPGCLFLTSVCFGIGALLINSILSYPWKSLTMWCEEGVKCQP